jgi:hypothetical protein
MLIVILSFIGLLALLGAVGSWRYAWILRIEIDVASRRGFATLAEYIVDARARRLSDSEMAAETGKSASWIRHAIRRYATAEKVDTWWAS